MERGICPFCGSNLYFEDSGKYTCFSCLYTGDKEDIIPDLGMMSVKKEYNPQMIKICNDAALHFQANLYKCDYIKTRNISKETQIKFRLGYADDSLVKFLRKKGYTNDEMIAAGLAKEKEGKIYDVFFNRLMFPIFDHNNMIVGFGGRKTNQDSNSPKYLNSPETEIFRKKENLYGIQDVENFETIYMVEGFMDVISLHQAGVKNSVASLGTAVGRKHAQLLKNLGTKNLILCLDSDNAGVNAALKVIPMLSRYFNVKVLNVPEAKDPDEYIKRHSAEELYNLKICSWQEFYISHKGLNTEFLATL